MQPTLNSSYLPHNFVLQFVRREAEKLLSSVECNVVQVPTRATATMTPQCFVTIQFPLKAAPTQQPPGGFLLHNGKFLRPVYSNFAHSGIKTMKYLRINFHYSTQKVTHINNHEKSIFIVACDY